jgi:hypothetical protein
MTTSNRIPFSELYNADLIVDAIYEGGTSGNASDEVISKLLSVQNSSGFRFLGSTINFDLKYCVLFTTLQDLNWPDKIDYENGQFIYYGDNKSPGEIHETPKKGNVVLRESYKFLHQEIRTKIPPFFIFSKSGEGRDVQFKGLAVPGYPGISQTDDLLAIWKHSPEGRFQNYKAIFTILDIPIISRKWIEDLKNGNNSMVNAPEVYKQWINTGRAKPLKAEPTKKIRSKEEQIPFQKADLELINTIYDYYSNPYEFEKCAIEIARLMDSNIIECDRTRPWVDGGRDATGKYRIGSSDNGIDVEFALEAKRYKLDASVGVKEVSRLISRLRYRQFGIFVTTSYIHRQAYQEIIEDRHPVLIISAIDIVKILKEKGINSKAKLKTWLDSI